MSNDQRENREVKQNEIAINGFYKKFLNKRIKSIVNYRTDLKEEKKFDTQMTAVNTLAIATEADQEFATLKEGIINSRNAKMEDKYRSGKVRSKMQTLLATPIYNRTRLGQLQINQDNSTLFARKEYIEDLTFSNKKTMKQRLDSDFQKAKIDKQLEYLTIQKQKLKTERIQKEIELKNTTLDGPLKRQAPIKYSPNKSHKPLNLGSEDQKQLTLTIQKLAQTQKKPQKKETRFDNDSNDITLSFINDSTVHPRMRGPRRLTQDQTKVSISKPVTKRINFSEVNCKYDDYKRLFNPLRDLEYTVIDKLTIGKMKDAGRYPIPEKLLNQPYKVKILSN